MCLWPSLLQSLLYCPVPLALSFQAADTHLAFPASSYPSISLHSLISLHPHWLFLEAQSRGLIQTPFV